MTSLLSLQKSLSDLVGGIRKNKKNESQFIQNCIDQIREELKSPNQDVVTVAVQKLTFLQMMGYNMDWAAFKVLEVMSSTRFSNKRIGYLAASQSFHTGISDAITLSTQLLRKDMTSPFLNDSALALNTLANICNPDLARDLAPDVLSLLNNSKSYIRKKACIVLYKIFFNFPDSLRPSFPRLKEKLDDPDPGVVAAAVNVICELARKNPKNYLTLAAKLFAHLNSSDNTWMLIKITKLFGAFLKVEKRMAKKLIGPLTQKLNEPRCAMSLQYEIIQTCTTGLAEHLPTIKLCVQKLREFIDHQDRNLKYLGLVALNNLIEIHPKAVAEHRDVVIQCLESDDDSIRRRALDLVEGMASKKNLQDIVERLCQYMETSPSQEYRQILVSKVVNMCSKNTYALMTNFDWYISVLVKLAHLDSLTLGELLCQQMMDVLIRVKVARPNGIKNMLGLLRDPGLLYGQGALNSGGSCEVLYAAAWLVGEFVSEVENIQLALEAMLAPRVASLPAHIQAAYLQSVIKIFSYNSYGEAGLKLAEFVKDRISTFTQSSYLEVQERACFALELFNLYTELAASSGDDITTSLVSLFEEPLNPVHPKAQKKIPVPADLNLDQWINEPEEEEDEGFDLQGGFEISNADKKYSWFESESEEEKTPSKRVAPVPSGGDEVHEAYLQRVRNDPFYLGSGPSETVVTGGLEDTPEPVEITSAELGFSEPAALYTFPNKAANKKQRKKNQPVAQPVIIMTNEDFPEGVDFNSDDEKKPIDAEDDDPFSSISLDKPLTSTDEKIFARPQHYTPSAPAPKPTATKKTATKKATTKKGAKRDDTLIDFGEESAPKKKGTKGTKGTKKAAAKKKEAPQLKPLCADQNLAVMYEVKVTPSHPQHAKVNFAFKNLSQSTISRPSFNIRTNMQFQVDPQSNVTPELVLEKGAMENHSIILKVVNFFEPSQLPGILSYSLEGAGKSVEFKIALPCSSFIVPVHLEEKDFIDLLHKYAPQLTTKSIQLTGSLQDVVAKIQKQLKVDLVTLGSNAYLYGKSMQGHHVAVAVRQPSPQSLTIDVKCSNSTLGESLIQEISK